MKWIFLYFEFLIAASKAMNKLRNEMRKNFDFLKIKNKNRTIFQFFRS